jgi:hypothetical protein
VAERYTGFWDDGEHVRMTLGPMALDELIERLTERLRELEPGRKVRIDLISWRDEPDE